MSQELNDELQLEQKQEKGKTMASWKGKSFQEQENKWPGTLKNGLHQSGKTESFGSYETTVF